MQHINTNAFQPPITTLHWLTSVILWGFPGMRLMLIGYQRLVDLPPGGWLTRWVVRCGCKSSICAPETHTCVVYRVTKNWQSHKCVSNISLHAATNWDAILTTTLLQTNKLLSDGKEFLKLVNIQQSYRQKVPRPYILSSGLVLFLHHLVLLLVFVVVFATTCTSVSICNISIIIFIFRTLVHKSQWNWKKLKEYRKLWM